MWKFPGTLSIQKSPTSLHPYCVFNWFLIFLRIVYWSKPLSSYNLFSGRLYFFNPSRTFTLWTFRIFYTSRDNNPQGNLWKLTSIKTLHYLDYYFNLSWLCFWSTIKSVYILGVMNVDMALILKTVKVTIDIMEMHAPDIVPSAY
jgi:hypothetical protein